MSKTLATFVSRIARGMNDFGVFGSRCRLWRYLILFSDVKFEIRIVFCAKSECNGCM